jgi:hypothetical protein
LSHPGKDSLGLRNGILTLCRPFNAQKIVAIHSINC